MRSTIQLALAGASFLAFAAPALAQDVPADEGFNDAGEIVVSARRREESVQDVPAVVNAVTADSIAKLNIRDFKEVASVVPGLELKPNANGIGTVSTVRGVNFDVNTAGNNGTIQFYMNDAPVSSDPIFQALFDIGQIEVQRGPQGTLRGRASPSGAINVTFKRPVLGEVGATMMATVNDLNGKNVNGSINVPIIADKLAVRVAGLYSEDRGNRVRAFNNPASVLPEYNPNNESRGLRASVSADPFDGLLKLDFMYQSIDRKATQFDPVQSASEYLGGVANAGFISARDRLGVDTFPWRIRQRLDSYNWQAQLGLFGQRLYYVGHMQKNRIDTIEPFDKAGIFNNPYGTLLVMDGANASHLALPMRTGEVSQETHSRSETDSHEIRLQNDERVLGMFDYVVGYLNYKLNSPTILENWATAAGNPATPSSPSAVIKIPLYRYGKTKEESVFANLTLHLGESTEIAGGLRHIWYRSNTGGLQIAPGVPANTPINYAFDASTWTYDNPVLKDPRNPEKTIYSASIKHDVTEDLMVYGAFGTSWRAGRSLIGTPTNTPLWNSFLSTKDETSKSFELGIKSNWLDRRVTFNLTGYYQKFKNYGYALNEVLTVLPGTTPSLTTRRFTASVPVEVKGVEAELSARPIDGLSIGAMVSYTTGKIKNGLIPCVDMNSDGVPDTAAPDPAAYAALVGADNVDTCNANIRSFNSSPWAGTVQAEYARPVIANAEGYLRGLFSWKGNAQGDPTNQNDSVKGHGILNMYAGIRDADGAWEVSLYGKNLTNTFRVLTRTPTPLGTRVSGYTQAQQRGFGYYGVTLTEPREFGINARIAIGSR